MIKVYHNNSCSKSRAALAFLDEQKVDYVIQNYLIDPPSKEELAHILQLLNMKPLQLIRKGEAIFKEKYADFSGTDEEWMDIMLAHPILIERPILIMNDKAVIARPLENVQVLLNT